MTEAENMSRSACELAWPSVLSQPIREGGTIFIPKTPVKRRFKLYHDGGFLHGSKEAIEKARCSLKR
jgi:hypothetical protein